MAEYRVTIARTVTTYEWATVEVEAENRVLAGEAATELAEVHGIAELSGDEYLDSSTWSVEDEPNAIRELAA